VGINDERKKPEPFVPETRVVPVIEEELVTGTRRVKTGSVRIRKKVHRLQRTVDLPTIRDVVEVTHRPINQVVTEVPQAREEGDTLIIPVVEEEIVVSKRLVLKEEILVRRTREQTRSKKEVTIAREVATVERLDANGAVVSTVPSAASPKEAERSFEKPPATAEAATVNMRPKPLLTPDPVVQQRVRRGLLD
jgi:uncharacterized protein (TIGR02271 family)